MWRDWNPHPLLVVYRIVQSLWNTVWQFLRMLNIESPHDRAIPLKGLHPRQMYTYVHAKPCIGMFTEALFAIAPKWKQPKCSSSLPLGAPPKQGCRVTWSLCVSCFEDPPCCSPYWLHLFTFPPAMHVGRSLHPARRLLFSGFVVCVD